MSRRQRNGEEGAAAVEVALMLVVLTPLLLYAIFFTEVGLARLKAREASRYLAWEAAAAPLSDWADANHARRFDRVRREVLREIRERWGDDLDGATPVVAPARAPAAMALSMQGVAPETELTNGDASESPPEAEGHGTAAAAASTALLHRFGFDEAGYLRATVSLGAVNRVLGTMPLTPTRMLPFDRFEWVARQALVADAWNLERGEGVDDSTRGRCAATYCLQVQRMLSAGAGTELPSLRDSGVMRLLGAFGVHSPSVAAVASLPLSNPRSEDSAVNLVVADPRAHAAMRRHYTNAFKDTFVRARSVLFQSYQRRGAHYLGCPEPQRPEGVCAYAPQ